MSKEEKINFVIRTFESVTGSYINGTLILPKHEEVWLHRYIKSAGFENSLQIDSNLEDAYKVALKVSRM